MKRNMVKTHEIYVPYKYRTSKTNGWTEYHINGTAYSRAREVWINVLNLRNSCKQRRSNAFKLGTARYRGKRDALDTRRHTSAKAATVSCHRGVILFLSIARLSHSLPEPCRVSYLVTPFLHRVTYSSAHLAV